MTVYLRKLFAVAFTVTQINMADETDSKDAVEIVEEFVFESLSPEEIEVFNLLSEFEVQAEVISAFISKYSLFVKRISSDPFFLKQIVTHFLLYGLSSGQKWKPWFSHLSWRKGLRLSRD